MSDDRREQDHTQNDADDLGPPLVELQELRAAWSPPEGSFLARVRGRIHRRLIAADTVDFATSAFFGALFAYLDLVLRALSPPVRPTAPDATKESDGHGR